LGRDGGEPSTPFRALLTSGIQRGLTVSRVYRPGETVATGIGAYEKVVNAVVVEIDVKKVGRTVRNLDMGRAVNDFCFGRQRRGEQARPGSARSQYIRVEPMQ
jgi:hypothetical protein